MPLREIPDYCQGKTQAQETRDTLVMLVVVMLSAVALCAFGFLVLVRYVFGGGGQP